MAISGKTKLLGVVGYPVEHSLSPVMHNRAFEFLGLDYCYLPLPVSPAELGRGVAGLKAFGFAGFNVTVPHKEAVMEFLDEVDQEALDMGAVNTVVNREGRLKGYNTDGRGFLRAVQQLWNFTPKGQRVVLLGAGGAAKGIALALLAAGAQELTIANRHLARAIKLKEQLDRLYAAKVRAVALDDWELDRALGQSSLVVQTTSVGMYPGVNAAPVVDPQRLHPHNLVYDIIFNPRETKFLAGARERGCRTANGLGMLLYQGALAIELWTGQPAPIKIMEQVLREKSRM